MKALFIILNKTEYLDDILAKFVEFNVKGATIIDSQGMASAIVHGDHRDIPLFGSLRKLISDVHPYSKTIFTVLSNDIVDRVVAAVKEILQEEKRPGVAFMFTVPVDNVYQVNNK